MGEECVDTIVETSTVAVLQLTVLGVVSTAMAIGLVVKTEEESSALVVELKWVCDTL